MVEQVISQQPAESEDPQARRNLLDNAIRQLQEQQDQQAGRQQGTPRRGASLLQIFKPFLSKKRRRFSYSVPSVNSIKTIVLYKKSTESNLLALQISK